MLRQFGGIHSLVRRRPTIPKATSTCTATNTNTNSKSTSTSSIGVNDALGRRQQFSCYLAVGSTLSPTATTPALSRCSISRSTSSTTTDSYNKAATLTSADKDNYDDDDDDDAMFQQLLDEYAAKEATPISLQDLTTTYSHGGGGGGTTGDGATSNSSGTSGNSSTSTSNNMIKDQFRGRMGRRLAAERTMLKVAILLWSELPIRLAHRIQDLDQIGTLSDMPSVGIVKQIYRDSFRELITTPKPEPHTEKKFATLLTTLYEKHSNVLLLMAKGASEFRRRILLLEQQQQQQKLTSKDDKNNYGGSGDDDDDNHLARQLFAEQEECHHFLNRFYFSRVGIRVLAGQYLSLRQQLLVEATGTHHHQQQYHHSQLKMPANTPPPGSSSYVGMVCKHTSPYRIVQRAIDDATRLCQQQYPDRTPPVVHIGGRLDLTFCYIPTHLHYIILELLKNAMRATMDHHYNDKNNQNDNDSDDDDNDNNDTNDRHKINILHPRTMLPSLPPPISVIIADGMDNEDVIIKVSDEGGGIPRSQMDYIWSYLFTTADPQVQERFLHETTTKNSSSSPSTRRTSSNSDNNNNNDDDDDPNQAPILAGLGYGLPMSRAYARYFGGDLDLLSMEGYGTDAFCHLVRLEDKATPVL